MNADYLHFLVPHADSYGSIILFINPWLSWLINILLRALDGFFPLRSAYLKLF